MDDTGGGLVVIFGGRSEIGTQLAVRLAPGATVVLAARTPERLEEQVAAVRAAGAAAVHVRAFDADDLASHGPLVESIVADHGPITTAVLAFGILGDQARAEVDPAHAVAVVHTDYVAQVSLLTVLAATMRARTARLSSSRRWPAYGCAGPTTSMVRPKRASTGSPTGWPTRCTAPVCGC